MILSEQDINRIIENSSKEIDKEDFVVYTSGYFKLKNKGNHCVFFDNVSKLCKIYKYRPQGCRYYPLIYNYEKNECDFDVDCPRIHLFYRNKYEFKRICKNLKKFLRDQLKISVL